MLLGYVSQISTTAVPIESDDSFGEGFDQIGKLRQHFPFLFVETNRLVGKKKPWSISDANRCQMASSVVRGNVCLLQMMTVIVGWDF